MILQQLRVPPQNLQNYARHACDSHAVSFERAEHVISGCCIAGCSRTGTEEVHKVS